MDMMTRRRAMMGGIAVPEWDYEWDYTDGLPTANGWTQSKSGTASATEQNDGLLIKANASSYLLYNNNDYATAKGVIEAKLYIPTTANANNKNLAFLRIGDNSSVGLLVFFTLNASGTKKIRIYTNTTFTSCAAIGDWEFNMDYVLNLSIDNGIGAVTLNGTTLSSTINLANQKTTGGPRFGAQNGNGAGAVWKYIRIKKDRV